MTTVSNSTAANWRRVTPLRLYLLIICGLTLLVTSPFTVGPGLVRLGDWLSRAFGVISTSVASVQWPAHHPVLCWFLLALLGGHLLGGVGLCLWKAEAVSCASRRIAVVALMFVIGLGLYVWLYTFEPSPQVLYDAFLAAGGVPEILVFVATAIVVVLAYLPIIAGGLALVAAVLTVFSCAF
ncbi:hypothetical protein [Burkholderia ambifaria]|uniref:hypothetical protein n=1 Tax=Burkholderia ambifaria TaxID=152480 RepID=UPI000F7FCA9B|nr:hypothetical protein [Burkholderia ambifaria]